MSCKIETYFYFFSSSVYISTKIFSVIVKMRAKGTSKNTYTSRTRLDNSSILFMAITLLFLLHCKIYFTVNFTVYMHCSIIKDYVYIHILKRVFYMKNTKRRVCMYVCIWYAIFTVAWYVKFIVNSVQYSTWMHDEC